MLLPLCQCIIMTSKASYVRRPQEKASRFQMDGMRRAFGQTECVL